MDKIYTQALSFLQDAVGAEGGDGDGIWITEFPLEEILLTLVEFNRTSPYGWQIGVEGDCIFWGGNQEGVIITTDKKYEKSIYNQVMLKY